MAHVPDASGPPRPGFPDPEAAIRLLEEFFFSRTDRVAVRARKGHPFPVDPGRSLSDLLRTHVIGESAPAAAVLQVRRDGTTRAFKTRSRVGSYAVDPDGSTRWFCIDLDGVGHSHPLADPKGAALAILEAFEGSGLPVYLERSGGGRGWHIWGFFEQPVPAKTARELAFAILPDYLDLAAGGVAEPQLGRGIEVFPKQDQLRSKAGLGNLVWLPWWAGAARGGGIFYIPGDAGGLEPVVPDSFRTIGVARIDELLAEKAWESVHISPTSDSAGIPAAPPAASPDWPDWRRRALAALPLDAVYGRWLTGEGSGPGWLQCRDPGSPSGDQSPSAGVADGTGEAERGTFHSFISGRSESVFDFLIGQGMVADFRAATRRIAELSGVEAPNQSPPAVTEKSIPPSPVPRKSLPRIQINDRHHRDLVDDAWRAVKIANTPPTVFLREKELVRLRRARREGISIEPMSETSVFRVLSRTADWIRATEETETRTSPVRDIAKEMVDTPDDDLPPLDAVITTPVFGKDARLITAPGYHEADSLWFEPSPGLSLAPIPERPSPEEIAAARATIEEDLLGDFPFVSLADRAHAVAAILLPFCRRLFTGPTPIHLVSAPTQGTGKSLLCSVISIVASGRSVESRSLSENNEEARKMLTAELATGRPIVLLDNANDKVVLDCPPLAAVTTNEAWTDRLLGSSQMTSSENRALWLLTGNNPQLSPELTRRCVRIRLDSSTDEPWLRDEGEFRHPALLDWAVEDRGKLVRAVLLLVQGWIAEGKPKFNQRNLGSFGGWRETIGGILEVAGIPGFLDNLRALAESADSDSENWREFVGVWWEEFADRPKKVSELNLLCEERDLMVGDRGDGGERSQQTRLGKALHRAEDRVFDGLRVTRVVVYGGYRGRTCYALKPTGQGGTKSSNGESFVPGIDHRPGGLEEDPRGVEEGRIALQSEIDLGSLP